MATEETLVLVTGSTDGIGRQTALELAKAGARVVVHGRTQAKAERARDAVAAEAGSERVEAWWADLASLADVRAGAERFLERHDRLNVLVNNAGVFLGERRVTVDGLEETFAVNYLAHYLVTRLLLGALDRGAPSRIVNVSSNVHRGGALDLDDLQSSRGYSGYGAYAGSKLANVLFTVELARRLDPARTTANALHPGVIGTKLLRQGFGGAGGASLESGAATSVYLALSPDVVGVTGRYFDASAESRASAKAKDAAVATRLWGESERLAGLP